MKLVRLALLLPALMFVSIISNAQGRTKNHTFKDFDKVQIENINGEVEIELGKTYSIIVSFNDNEKEHIEIARLEDKLVVKLDSAGRTYWDKKGLAGMKAIL